MILFYIIRPYWRMIPWIFTHVMLCKFARETKGPLPMLKKVKLICVTRQHIWTLSMKSFQLANWLKCLASAQLCYLPLVLMYIEVFSFSLNFYLQIGNQDPAGIETAGYIEICLMFPLSVSILESLFLLLCKTLKIKKEEHEAMKDVTLFSYLCEHPMIRNLSP